MVWQLGSIQLFALSMTFGNLNNLIGSTKFNTLQPHIVLTNREILAHFRAVLHEDQLASGAKRLVEIDNALNVTSRAVLAVFMNNGVSTVREVAVKR